MHRMAWILVPKMAVALLFVVFTTTTVLAEDDLFSPLQRTGEIITTADDAVVEEEEMTEMETVVHLLRRIEKALVYVLVMSCFISGQLFWRLAILSKSQRNIL